MPDLQRVAFKITCKRTIIITFNGGDSSYNVLNKVRILQLVNHPRIISLEDEVDTANFLFIVLELPEGGELFNNIIEKTKLKEARLSCTSSKLPWQSSTYNSRRSVIGT